MSTYSQLTKRGEEAGGGVGGREMFVCFYTATGNSTNIARFFQHQARLSSVRDGAK